MRLQTPFLILLATATLGTSASPLAVPKDHNLSARGVHHASKYSEDIPIVIPPPKSPRDIEEDKPTVIPPPKPQTETTTDEGQRPRWTVTQIVARVLQAAREENANVQVKRRRRRAHP